MKEKFHAGRASRRVWGKFLGRIYEDLQANQNAIYRAEIITQSRV